MTGQVVESLRNFSVVCAWCGSEIRRGELYGDSERESRGMCQTCFRRMLEENTRVASPPVQAYASER